MIEESKTADFINPFFINVGNTPSCKIKDPPNIVTGHTNKWSVQEVHETEVYNLIKHIKCTKPSGITGVNNTVIKGALKVFISPVTHMYNTSLKEGNFPDSWKLATVVPIPKAGDPSQVS